MMKPSRRLFLQTTSWAAGALLAGVVPVVRSSETKAVRRLSVGDLPVGSAPPPVPLPHFPTRLHAWVWRNWCLVPLERMARVVGASAAELAALGRRLGLPPQPALRPDLARRAALTIIRRNWHLLPYDQLLALLDWTPERMAFTLREDDFLYVKLGHLKPRCEPLRYAPPDAEALAREAWVARVVREEFPAGVLPVTDPLFGFVARLSAKPSRDERARRETASRFSPRFCYSYFALYGDPLLEPAADPYPEGYLARLAACGVNGVWLQGVLYKLARFPWEPELSARHLERLASLGQLVARARRHGIGVYLYLNEPRAMPLAFYTDRPGMKGVTEGDHATLCTSDPAVQTYLREAVTGICRAVPDLAGLFTITGSENLTHCWSHGGGAGCPRCGPRGAAAVIGELNGLFHAGIQAAGSAAQLLAWDWGWADDWVEGIIQRLPSGVSLMSVSEWSLPLRRGGVDTVVGEYSISAIGPGPRAKRHWALARRRGLKTVAKIQAGNTWELSAVPYIPAVANVARHAANLCEERVDGLMLGWTLGGYPSPNLEVLAEVGREADAGSPLTPEAAMRRVAERRYGATAAAAVVRAWERCSVAFSEFPFAGGLVYNAPMQLGPSNLLWGTPTGYRATMVGFPYDDLEGWRQQFPATVFVGQFNRMAEGFEQALAELRQAVPARAANQTARHREALRLELSVIAAAAAHFRSVANQARFVLARQALAAAPSPEAQRPLREELAGLLAQERELARRLHALQCADSRLGFEASNQYYYLPLDLVEKVLNCRDLAERWLR